MQNEVIHNFLSEHQTNIPTNTAKIPTFFSKNRYSYIVIDAGHTKRYSLSVEALYGNALFSVKV